MANMLILKVMLNGDDVDEQATVARLLNCKQGSHSPIWVLREQEQ
jgi:hypothetical protein